MNPFAIAFLIISAMGILLLPRRLVLLPLLGGCCYMTQGQGVVVAGMNFPFMRLLILIALGRIVLRREYIAGNWQAADWLVTAWAVWMLFASLFHKFEDGSGPVFAMGIIFNIAGVYVLIRVYCRDINEFTGLVRLTSLLLIPVAVEMLFEKFAGKNLFSVFGGLPVEVLVRNGKLRAQGPFRHAILAGTVGAVCAPLMLGIWRTNRSIATAGLIACTTIVVASASSGPMMSLMFGVFAAFLWHHRSYCVHFKWLAILIILSASMVMNRPFYYLLDKIDLTGGSTGWHRARLIEMTVEHWYEWIAFGTDRTRHWMPTGVSWNPEHTDITNYYIQMGVWGGLPAMVLLIMLFVVSFRVVGRLCAMMSFVPANEQFMIWCLGSSLFSHAATCISVSYFDQSFIFLYLAFGAITSAWSLYRRGSVNVCQNFAEVDVIVTSEW